MLMKDYSRTVMEPKAENRVTRRVFVQDRRTHAFLNGEHGWTSDAENARDFQTSLTALAYCLQNGLLDTQIVIRFPNPNTADVIVPVQSDALRE